MRILIDQPLVTEQFTLQYTFTMLSSKSVARIDAKRRALLGSKKRQFAKAQFEEQDYSHRLNFYTLPPTGDVSLEQFEEWGIARLKGTQLAWAS